MANPRKLPSRRLRPQVVVAAPAHCSAHEIPQARDLAPTLRFLRWWEAVHAAVQWDLQRFKKLLHRCRRRSSLESVHELRVVTRRLGVWSDWLVALDPSESPPRARRRLRSLLHALSRIRDCQVHQALLDHVPVWLQSVAKTVLRRLRAEESVLSDRVRHRCRLSVGWFCRDIPRRMRGLTPLSQGIRARSPSLVWIRRLTVGALSRVPESGSLRARSWHRWRVSLRRLRFAIESVGRCPGRSPTSDCLERVLKPLGTVQDFDSLARFLGESGASGRVESPGGRRLLRWVECRRDGCIRRLDRQGVALRWMLGVKKPVSSEQGAP